MSGRIAWRSFADLLRAAAAKAQGHHGSRQRLQQRVLLLAAFLLLSRFGEALAAENTTIKIGGAGSSLSAMRPLAAAFAKANTGVTVNVLPSLGNTGGIKAATTGAIDIGVSARPLSDAERSQGVTVIEYGWTPLVFAVSQATRATEVTTAQLVEIYAGKMTGWPSGDPIRVIMRPSSDTDMVKLKSMSAQMNDAVTAASARPGMLLALTDADVVEQLNTIPGALGVSSLSEALASPTRLKILKLDGIEPSPASLTDDSYPLYLAMFMVTREPLSAPAAKFIDFVQSAPGRTILTDAGYFVPTSSWTRQP